MKPNSLFIVIVLVFLTLTAFTDPSEKKLKRKYFIEIESFKNVDAKFDIVVTMEGHTTKLVEQDLPFTLELITTDLKCLVDATDYVKITLKDEYGYVQSNAKAAHLQSENDVKKIYGL